MNVKDLKRKSGEFAVNLNHILHFQFYLNF